MRCYFHLFGPDEVLLDDEGVEVASIEEARTEALKARAELLREAPLHQREWNGWCLNIANEAGEILSTIPLSLIAPKSLRDDAVRFALHHDLDPTRADTE